MESFQNTFTSLIMPFLKKHKLPLISTLTLIPLYFLRKHMKGPKAICNESLVGKIIIVTGSSSGIGIETAYQLLNKGATVIMACRDEKKTLEVINNYPNKTLRSNAYFMKLDQSSFTSVINFANEFKNKFDKLDILVNNAGAVYSNYTKTEDNLESTFQVNTLSPMLLSFQLLDMINNSKGRIINVASKGYRRAKHDSNYYDSYDVKTDNASNEKDYSGLMRYCSSKLGNILFTQELDEYCKANGLDVKTASLHPGVISTELAREYQNKWLLRLFLLSITPIFWFISKPVEYGAQTTLSLCYVKD